MIVLGINEAHGATAAVLRDGAIIGCASEERVSRLKNDAGYPRRAVDRLLSELGLRNADIDVVALSGLRAVREDWINRSATRMTGTHDSHSAQVAQRLDQRLRQRLRKIGSQLHVAPKP